MKNPSDDGVFIDDLENAILCHDLLRAMLLKIRENPRRQRVMMTCRADARVACLMLIIERAAFLSAFSAESWRYRQSFQGCRLAGALKAYLNK